MNAQEIKDLIHKFQNGSISDEERVKLESIWQQYSEDETFLNALSDSEQKHLEMEMFGGIKERIAINEVEEETSKTRFRLSFTYKVAASFIVIVIASVFLYNYFIKKSSVIYQTRYGQVLKVVLPDNSVVTLNGNSSISFPRNWESNQAREVWLEGEAFFSVTHTKSHRKFIVNTSRKVDIEVLGTEFNVSDRKDELRVVLNSGKVKLKIDEGKHNEVIMAPGNMVEFKGDDKKYVKKVVDPDVYSAWTSDRMIFDNATLGEISSVLLETYGLSLEFSDASLLKETFSASFPKNDINVLIKAIAKSFDLKVTKNGNTVKMIKR